VCLNHGRQLGNSLRKEVLSDCIFDARQDFVARRSIKIRRRARASKVSNQDGEVSAQGLCSGQLNGLKMDSLLEAFELLDICVGTIVAAEAFPEARKPAYKLTVDFGGDIGIRRSSVQITANYTASDLPGKQVLAVLNFPPKRIAGFSSEILVLGLPDENGAVAVIRPDKPVPNGGRLY